MKHTGLVPGFVAGGLAVAALGLIGPYTRAEDTSLCSITNLQPRLATLEQRIRELEGRHAEGSFTSLFTAPFVVNDGEGNPILRIAEHQLTLFDPEGNAAVELVAYDDGGFISANSGTLTAAIGAANDGAGVLIEEDDITRLDLGRNPEHGSYRLVISGDDGQTRAALGEDQDQEGSGSVQVFDTAGGMRAGMNVSEEGRGQVWVQNADQQVVAALKQGLLGGLLEINSTDGRPMVVAGVTEAGIGVVRAGPGSFAPGYGLLGLPGSYIAGKAQ